jgi:hypothetical protein
MNILIYIYAALHVVMSVAIGRLLTITGQPPVWRFVLGLIQVGALWNLAGLIWFGYSIVWPGEPIITCGFCLIVLGLIFFPASLMTRQAEVNVITHDFVDDTISS